MTVRLKEQGYDPHAWNEWPSVVPPIAVDMRLEWKRETCNGDTVRFGVRANFDGSCWWTFERSSSRICGKRIDLSKVEHVRFRPWDDDTLGGRHQEV